MTSTTPPRKSRRGFRQRGMAWLLASNGERMHRMFGATKAHLLAPLSGSVLELGPGAGANFRYFQAGVQWAGVEPNEHNLPPLRAEAARFGVAADVRLGYAEALPYPDDSLDNVVTTLVLCSVDDVRRTLEEVRRVLKPGGSYVFLEHVAAPQGSLSRMAQDLLTPLWGLLADGCHPNRELAEAIAAAGFDPVELERFDVFLPLVRPHIAGIVQKP